MSRGKDGLTGVQREMLAKVGDSLFEPQSGPDTAMANKLLDCGLLIKVSTRRYKLSPTGRMKLGMSLRLDIPPELKVKLEEEIKRILHAQRDCMRNLHEDTTQHKWCCSPQHACGTYDAETFGILRALQVMGLGQISKSTHHSDDLSTWREGLMEEVLKEENFGGSNECDFCLKTWGKDGAGRKR